MNNPLRYNHRLADANWWPMIVSGAVFLSRSGNGFLRKPYFLFSTIADVYNATSELYLATITGWGFHFLHDPDIKLCLLHGLKRSYAILTTILSKFLAFTESCFSAGSFSRRFMNFYCFFVLLRYLYQSSDWWLLAQLLQMKVWLLFRIRSKIEG